MGVDPWTPITPKPPPSEPFYRKIFPLTLLLSFLRCLREVKKRGVRDNSLSPPALEDLQGSPSPLGLNPSRERISSPLARCFSLRCQRNPPTQEALESSRRPPTANSTGIRGSSEESESRRDPLSEFKTTDSKFRAGFSEKSHP